MRLSCSNWLKASTESRRLNKVEVELASDAILREILGFQSILHQDMEQLGSSTLRPKKENVMRCV